MLPRRRETKRAREEKEETLVSLLDEGVGNGFHAILWADNDDSGSAADHESEGARVVRQLERVVRVTQVLDRVVEDDVEEGIVALEDPGDLTSSLELDANRLLQEA